MKATLIVGAGGVAGAVAHKCAQHNDELGNLCVASRTLSKCDAIVEDIRQRGNLRDTAQPLQSAQVNAREPRELVELIRSFGADLVLNAASPECNVAVMEACLEAGAHYLDTAVHEEEGAINEPAPWYANYEWPYRPRFEAQGITGILGIGFDPGAVNAYCAYVHKHLVTDIDTIDIMDVNAGDHGRFFATNFDPEVNLREIAEDVVYWENGKWVTIPCHSKSRTYDFPVVGEQKVYSMGHDEIHSLALNIPARRIEFWMGFSENYLNVFNVLNRLGLLSMEPVDVEGTLVIPLRLLKSVLPKPASLAAGYTGAVCIGCLVKGMTQGEPRQVFIYSACDHRDCFNDIGSQAISYTTAVPMVTAALLVARGEWNVRRLVNVEELDPDPFMALMPELGIEWHVREHEAGFSKQ